MTKALLITQCQDPQMWYAKLVGHAVPLRRDTGTEYLSCEPSGYTNIVRKCDAQVIDISQAQAPTATLPAHVFRELVNDLRGIAVNWYGSQQLRERISGRLRENIRPTGPGINPLPNGD